MKLRWETLTFLRMPLAYLWHPSEGRYESLGSQLVIRRFFTATR